MSQELAQVVTPEDMKEVVRHAGVDMRDLLKSHFIERAQRVQSRDYWAGAAEGTEYVPDGDLALITVRHLGVRLHLKGGKVYPSGKTSKVTGRPIRSLLVPGSDSPLRKRRVTLEEAGFPADEVRVLVSETGHPYLAHVKPYKRKVNGKTAKVTPLGMLLKSVKHDPDPTVLPDAEEIGTVVKEAAVSTLRERISKRRK